MDFDILVAQVKTVLKQLDTSQVTEHIAIHVNVTDMEHRPFYIEISQEGIEVEPYAYYDKDVTINADSKRIINMLFKEADLKAEYAVGNIGVYGNLHKLAVLRNLVIDQVQL